MKKIKNAVAALAIVSCLNFTVSTPKSAQAGIILIPVLVGIVLLVIGIQNGDTLLIILDADGNLPQSALEDQLARKYAFIDDREVIQNLASTIREKATTTPTIEGKKTVTLTENEVLTILEPTGLNILNHSAVMQLVSDLR